MTPPAAGASRALDYRAPAHRRRKPPVPRRVSGPVRGNVAGEPARTPGIALRTAGALERVSASNLLDRLIVGRAWIGLLAFALIGVVAMQLVVLKLNTGIGSTLQRQVLLQRENAELGIENSTYSAESRVTPLAAAAGMTFAPPGTVHFVAASAADVPRAASVLASAAQASAGGQPGSGEAVTNSTASQATAATSETASSTETSGDSPSGSGDGGSTGASSEQPSATSSESGTSTSVASPTATPASSQAQSSEGGEQAQGASAAAPAGEGAASSSGASAYAGGTQAGPRG